MAETRTVETESEVKCVAEKMYHMIKHKLHHLPDIFPEVYKDSEIVEGDGTRNGCVRIWKYVLPDSPELLFVKCKNEELDDEIKSISLLVLDGDLLKYYKRFVARIFVTPKGNGCLVKWVIEFQKESDDISDPHHYLELFAKISTKLEAQILSELK